MYAATIRLHLNTFVTVCPLGFGLTFGYLCSKFFVFVGLIHSVFAAIVSGSRYSKILAHLTDRIFLLMPIDHQKFYVYFHFLSVSERKSRISSFSISRCLIFASFRASTYFSSLSLSF